MLKQLDMPVSKPAQCHFRHCAVDAEIVHHYNRFCYCRILPEFLHATKAKRGDDVPEWSCSNKSEFPQWCPLAKVNINVWRDR